jgi:hypothetical protein
LGFPSSGVPQTHHCSEVLGSFDYAFTVHRDRIGSFTIWAPLRTTYIALASVKAHPAYRNLLTRIIKKIVEYTGFTLMERLAYISAFGFDKDVPEETILWYADESIVRSVNPSP